MKIVAWLAGLTTLLTAGVYMVVSLNRWEWSRALFFGLIVLIVEVALATGLVLRKLTHIDSGSLNASDVEEILRRTRPDAPDRFAWLRDSNERLSVFVTFLVGGGVVVSALAWLLDRIAATTTTPSQEHRLAAQLGAITYPPGGLLVDESVALAEEVPGSGDQPALTRLLGLRHRR